MLRDKGLTSEMSYWDMRGTGSRRPRLVGAEGGLESCSEEKEEGTGYTKHGAPAHENQMKGRLNGSLGL